MFGVLPQAGQIGGGLGSQVKKIFRGSLSRHDFPKLKI